MNELHYGQDIAIPQARSVTTVFGWVMGLVGISLGFLAIGAYLGRDLSRGAAITCSLVAVGMLLGGSFSGKLMRVGGLGLGWLFATAALIGLGAGPAMHYYASAQRGLLAEAAVGTALTVAAMGALGLSMSRDLRSWMRPVSIGVFIACGVGIVWTLISGPLNPVLSMIIFAGSSLLLVIDFNYVRKHATEDDVVWLATGIFVSIVNIFFSLLNLLSD